MRFTYIVLSVGIILLLSIFSLNYYKQYYPLYLEMYDIAYHLGQTVGMDRAGGLTLTSFWQDAAHPIPVYYPPFYHFCQLVLLRSGITIGSLAKYLTWLLYPLVLFSFWSFMSVSFGTRMGFYGLTLLSLPPLFMEKIWGHPTFGLFCVLLPLVCLTLFKKRYPITLILLVISMATHLSAFILPPVLFIYALHSREYRKPVFILLVTVAALSLPAFLIFVKRVSFYSSFSSPGLGESFKAILSWAGISDFFDYKRQYYVYLGILALAGLIISYFRRGRYLLLSSFFITAVMVNSLSGRAGDPGTFRYNQILPFLIFPMLGAVALDEMQAQFKNSYAYVIPFILVAVCGVLFYALSAQPVYNRTPNIVFLCPPKIWAPPNLLFSMEQRTRILELIKENVAEDEIVYNSAGMNLTNMLSAFSRRSFTGDLKARPKMSIAEKPAAGYRLLEKMNPQFNVYLLRDKDKAGKAAVPSPVISYHWIRNGFILLGILVLLDLLWSRR